ncbi:hypothetical protein ACFRJ9_21740 [Paenarthrobacter sp. NPDC056912]|uniref:hypothetical protein n=1 Tax=Paenarthrobacter sp. NPDC056912 TaxID=3345965 RepID=UPI00366E481F
MKMPKRTKIALIAGWLCPGTWGAGAICYLATISFPDHSPRLALTLVSLVGVNWIAGMLGTGLGIYVSIKTKNKAVMLSTTLAILTSLVPLFAYAYTAATH